VVNRWKPGRCGCRTNLLLVVTIDYRDSMFFIMALPTAGFIMVLLTARRSSGCQVYASAKVIDAEYISSGITSLNKQVQYCQQDLKGADKHMFLV